MQLQLQLQLRATKVNKNSSSSSSINNNNNKQQQQQQQQQQQHQQHQLECLLYAPRHPSILGAAGRIELTPANQLLVMEQIIRSQPGQSGIRTSYILVTNPTCSPLHYSSPTCSSNNDKKNNTSHRPSHLLQYMLDLAEFCAKSKPALHLFVKERLKPSTP
jgi:hypothetical protein